MNIIFDLGGVLLKWEPMKTITEFFPDKVSREKVVKEFLKHKDWAELDRGTLSYEKAIERANKRTDIPKAEIRKFLNEVPKILTPIPETLKLIKELKKKNHKLYILSNMFLEAADYLENKYPFWNLFDGIVFSARIKLSKPSPEIYHYILDKFNLIPEETVFLDDLKDNVDAAVIEGINGIQFTSAAQAKTELEKLI